MQFHLAEITAGLIAAGAALAVSAAAHAGCNEPSLSTESEMVWVEGGSFRFGSDRHYPEERPAHEIAVEGFWLGKYEVTNRQFKLFVDKTNYKTVAERHLSEEDFPDIPKSQREPGAVVFKQPKLSDGNIGGWWHFVAGANWQHPTGPDSNLENKLDHPVVHIAWEDAKAYADWLGHQLPTETQWEYAAKLSLAASKTPSSSEQPEEANTWQGLFPMHNLSEDGYSGTAPVGCYQANPAGAHDMIGNVWEWTASHYYPAHDTAQTKPLRDNYPNGFDPGQRGVSVKVLKGGSFLCAPNYCRRYRPAARHAQDTTLGTSHIGFRTVINSPAAPEKKP